MMNVVDLSRDTLAVQPSRLHRACCAVCGTHERLVGYFALPISALPPGARNELSFCGEPGHRDHVSRIHSDLCILAMPPSTRRIKRLPRVKERYRKVYGELKVPGQLPAPEEIDKVN